VSYFHVAPNPADVPTPHIWVEHASQAIVEHTPAPTARQRAASLKVWDDDWTGEIHAVLQLDRRRPGRIYKFKAPRRSNGDSGGAAVGERECRASSRTGSA
jgi:hypothetical protein